MKIRLRDPVSGLTHLVGACLSLGGSGWLVLASALADKVGHLLPFSIFGASLVSLYTASSLYHLLPVSERGVRVLRRIDHTMIYVLIAGTYTPVCLIALRGVWGWSLFAVIWTLAAAGIAAKWKWMNTPRWLTVGLYVFMGWLGVVGLYPLLQTLPAAGVWWLLAGGLFYSGGAVIYALKRPNPIPNWFGFHELWHLFVMAGSFSHFWLMARYIAQLG